MIINNKTFLVELLKKQEELQKHIKQERERDRYDAYFSFIAEAIEFLEETDFTFKTWKKKEKNEKSQLEEFVDILFFLLEDCLNCLDYYPITEENDYIIESTNKINEIYKKNEPETNIKRSIFYLVVGYMMPMPDKLMKYFYIGYLLGYDLQTIISMYEEKWEKNMKRIGTEWN